ncbi:MAG: PhoH family protein [Actinobacteria bacterium]|nr:PhoH family protein [Actinomycetota bacterium]
MVETRKLYVPVDINPVELFGHNDNYLRMVEDSCGATIVVRGNEIIISGNETSVDIAFATFKELLSILDAGKRINESVVEEVIRIISEGEEILPSDIFSDIILVHRGKTIAPKTAGQKRYVDAIRSHTITFGIGPAGTGKTYLAMAMAAKALKEKTVGRIILTRPAVEAGESLGYLPGGIYEKIDPYLRPLFDALFEMMDPQEFRRHLDEGTIEIAPLAYMRGRTLNDSFIILDEAQNTTAEQMKMFLTRLGFGSKVVITGDITQIDLPVSQRSGLLLVKDILKDIEGIAFVYLTPKDVVRHKLVQRIVEAYRKYEESLSGDTKKAKRR